MHAATFAAKPADAKIPAFTHLDYPEAGFGFDDEGNPKVFGTLIGGTVVGEAAVDTDQLAGDAVTEAKLADDAVSTDKIVDEAVTVAKMAADSVDTAQIVDDAVTVDKIAADAVDTAQIVDAAVETAKLADGAVTAAKAAVFVSTEQTGTGSEQDIAHGLGATPAAVFVAPTEHPGTPDTGAFDIAEGTHDGTNVKVTVTANVKFKVLAWA